MAKLFKRTGNLENEEGRFASASDANDVVPSLLPVGTSHKGLPYWKKLNTNLVYLLIYLIADKATNELSHVLICSSQPGVVLVKKDYQYYIVK